MKCDRQEDRMQAGDQKENKTDPVQQCSGRTAKEYLQQLYRADVILSQRVMEKEELRAEITRRMEHSGSIPKDLYNSRDVMQLIELEAQIDRMAQENARLKHEVICRIHELQNADRIKVLYKRYVRFEKFEQIAADLNYSVRNIYTIHGQALEEFQKKSRKTKS